MKKSIYISIPKAHHTKLTKFCEILKTLLGTDLEYFFHNIYSEYSNSLIKHSDIVIGFIPENGVIGRGVYTELQEQKPTFLYFEADNSFVPFRYCNVQPLNQNDTANWAMVKQGVYAPGFKLSYRTTTLNSELKILKEMLGLSDNKVTEKKSSNRRRLLL